MKDIPLFTTEYGIASIDLAELAYQSAAYIRVRSCVSGKTAALIDECVAFCRGCGVEHVYAAGKGLRGYPLDCTILQLRGSVGEGKCAELRPITQDNCELWRRIANERMAHVDHHATITMTLTKKLLKQGGAYFVCEGERILGIGLVQDGALQLIASTQRGAGECVLRTLAQLLPRDGFCLEVASTNYPALALYERLGFAIVAEKTRWHRVF